jgi:hypothetical protein
MFRANKIVTLNHHETTKDGANNRRCSRLPGLGGRDYLRLTGVKRDIDITLLLGVAFCAASPPDYAAADP